MLPRSLRHGLSFVTASLLVVACAPDPLAGWAPKPSADESETQSSESCGDIADDASSGSMKKCTGTKKTKGVCVPGAMLGKRKGTFEQADCAKGEECVPPAVVEAKDVPKDLKECKFGTSEGRCFSPLANDVLANYATLQAQTKDQCENGDVCTPCVSPLDGKATGLCPGMKGVASRENPCDRQADQKRKESSGVAAPPEQVSCPFQGTPIDTSKMSKDTCPAGMLCISADLVAENLRPQLPTCSKGLCAPEKSVKASGNHLPAACRADGDAEGRCLNAGLTEVAKAGSTLSRGTCDADERCVPCFDPRDGKSTGACSTVSCDQPKELPKTFAKCCGGRASCIPRSKLPASQQSSDGMEKLDCKGSTDVCVPNVFVENANFKPPACKGNFPLLGSYRGVCLSECLDMGFFEGVLDQANCGANMKCAPCENPLTGEPTGAPGCN